MIHQAIVRLVWDSFILGGILSCVAIFILALWRPPDRSIEDAVDFLVPVDLGKLEDLLDAAAEGRIRTSASVTEFRSIQRQRMYLYLEFLRRMSHNSGVLIQLGNCQVNGGRAELIEMARGLQDDGVRVRLYSLAASAKVHVWIFLLHIRIIPVPVLCELKEVCGIHGLEGYEKLKTAASMFFLQAGPSKLDQLLEHL